MPDLTQSLQIHDLGHLQIVAHFWDVPLEVPDVRRGLQLLVGAMLEPGRAAKVVNALPAAYRKALEELQVSGGRLPWSLFTRKYGAVRTMGPARRDREQPYLNPSGAAEGLWYRGLVSRAFFDSEAGAQEFAYIPEDLSGYLPAAAGTGKTPLGRPAAPAERETAALANDHILDHACTLLAALRLSIPVEQMESSASAWEALSPGFRLSPVPLKALLASAGFLDEAGMPLPEPTRLFLEAPRGEALAALVAAWKQSASFDELRLLPGVCPEGEWVNDPVRARLKVLDLLAGIPHGVWWSLPAFVAAVKSTFPDFQRPAGSYDSFYLRELSSGNFLRGFEHWDSVDGALIRYILCGPLHWLGIVDLAAPKGQAAPGVHAAPKEQAAPGEAPVTAFRFTRWAEALLTGRTPAGIVTKDEPVKVRSNARLYVPRQTPRSARYQIARFAEWEAEKDGAYHYRITPISLERARQQGLRTGQLIGLLRRYSSSMPPSLVRALERWDEHGSEARLEQVTILRLRTPEMLQLLRASRAARFLGDPLAPTVVIVKPGAFEKVLEVLAELGYLGEAEQGEKQ